MSRHVRIAQAVVFILAWILAAYAVAPAARRGAPEATSVMLQNMSDRTIFATSTLETQDMDTDDLYPVVHIVDGDTVDVLKDGAKVRVRLIGINTPESVDPRRGVQCFGIEASDEMKRLLEGQSVRLKGDPSQDTYDKYHRMLAYIFLPDATNVNEHMIAAGYAHEYTYRVPYRYQKEFKAAEAQAREAGRGLWKNSACKENSEVQ